MIPYKVLKNQNQLLGCLQCTLILHCCSTSYKVVYCTCLAAGALNFGGVRCIFLYFKNIFLKNWILFIFFTSN